MKLKAKYLMPLALLASFATFSTATLAKDKDATEQADANDNESFLVSAFVIPPPPPGKGQIVFYRKGGLGGAAIGCSVHENGQKVSSLGGGKVFIMVAEPGKHQFSVKSEAKDVLTLEVEPDETQFVQCKIKMGFLVGRPDMRPSTETEFRANKKLKLVNDDDMGPGPGALRAAEVRSAQAAANPAAASAPTPSN
jgi:hypothetical protein